MIKYLFSTKYGQIILDYQDYNYYMNNRLTNETIKNYNKLHNDNPYFIILTKETDKGFLFKFFVSKHDLIILPINEQAKDIFDNPKSFNEFLKQLELQ